MMKTNSNPNDKSVAFLYGNAFGRVLLQFILFIKIPKLLGFYLRTRLSKGRVKKFIAQHNIDMSEFEGVKFKTFNDFFTRRKNIEVNVPEESLIAPSDSALSVFKIEENSVFRIKGFDYTLEDFFANKSVTPDFEETLKSFAGGDCLVFRLAATDYHRYCYIDSGSLEKNHFIKGRLYSVQPAACENYRVYTKNRRSWTILHTDHFGDVAQIEVGAFSVGGICNHHEDYRFRKGEEKGYFDLHGSTIVLLFKKGAVKLKDEILEGTKDGAEYRVKYGQIIG
ncbi:MAG: phosphatidylserine decarboxylase [Treponema sp.]|nr:phosphatidylserine decarboxylase [Treponema sp.]